MQSKTASIIIIGNEILTGKTQEQNAAFLIGELHRLGVALRRVTVIPDDVEEIARVVRECAGQFDYVFTSGGVGPTHDDLTIAAVALAFNRPVIRNPELAALIHELFGENLDEARMRMADIPAGSELIASEGLRWPVVSTDNVYIFPGVPEILRSKFSAIRERFRTTPYRTTSVFTHEDEFDLAPRLSRVAAAHPEVEIGSYPTFGREEYRVKITLEATEPAAVESALSDLLQSLDPRLLVRVE
jgi:molybdenum cofactor synthesis domain-containing protein